MHRRNRFPRLANRGDFTVNSPIMSGIGLLSPSDHQETPASLSPNQKRELVQRVVNSQMFCRSPGLCAFLVYVTDHAVLGRTEKLKEQTIGTEVLGRKPNYDPADDNIVRVRAHELRLRLEKYFASEGGDEPVTIIIPRGAYAPKFVPRKSVLVETPTASEIIGTTSPPAIETRWERRNWLPLAAIILVALLASVELTRYVRSNDNRSHIVRTNDAIRDFWGQFFDKPNEELKIVYADTGFALWQDLNNETLDLGDYLGHKYLDVRSDKLLEVAARRATSPADLILSVHLATLAGEFGGQVNLQFARNANAEFFHHGNILLIGSRRSNPWIEVYEPSLNFELEQDPHSGAPLFRNRFPQSHEASVYAIPAMLDTQGTEEKEFTSYGVIALLKGCGNRGLTLLDEGLNMQATQAMGDLITDPQRLDTLLRSMGHKPGRNVAPFEALIQITSLPGGYDNPKVVAFRIQPAESCVGN
jgi:hypothetical protein